MRGRNTKDKEIGKDVEVAEYQEKLYIVMKFIHEEKYVNFNLVREGRRKREICNGVNVYISIVA